MINLYIYPHNFQVRLFYNFISLFIYLVLMIHRLYSSTRKNYANLELIYVLYFCHV